MKAYSMRTSLLLTIVIMGLLSVALTLFTGDVYFKQTLENRQQAFIELAELEVHNLWLNLKRETKSLGLSIQLGKKLTAAAENNKEQTLVVAIDEHFNRAYVTLGILDLKKIIVYDKQLNKITQSSRGEYVSDDVCPELIKKAKKRKGAERYKALHQVCKFNGSVRLVTMVPMGGLRLKGYLSIVVDPLKALAEAEQGLGIPLQIKSTSDEILFQSSNWPESYDMKNVMLVEYANKAGNEKAVANLFFASDVTELKNKLSKTRLNLVGFVVFSILLAVIVALFVFRRTIISPLNKINNYMVKIRHNKEHLKQEFSVEGSEELVVLAEKMNLLSNELSHLYSELEEKAFTDSLTGIPNRALLFDRLAQITLFARRDKAQAEFMLMMMDLNKFKQVNDVLGHHIGDELLVAVADRLKQALREADTVARIGGDEFAVILYAVNEKEVAISIAEKIKALIDKKFSIEGNDIEVGMSIGIARFPYDGESGEELMHCADMAMYQSKRNSLPYVFYEKSLGIKN